MEFLERALIDSLKVFITVFIFHVIFSFLEKKLVFSDETCYYN